MFDIFFSFEREGERRKMGKCGKWEGILGIKYIIIF
jgi:hypothetical protein